MSRHIDQALSNRPTLSYLFFVRYLLNVSAQICAKPVANLVKPWIANLCMTLSTNYVYGSFVWLPTYYVYGSFVWLPTYYVYGSIVYLPTLYLNLPTYPY